MNAERKIEIEEVSEAPSPPKARVSDAAETFERKRDYLEGFLSKPPAPEPAPETTGGELYEAVIEALVRGIERVTRIFG